MDERFQGKTCPLCKNPFKEDEAIVICSDCEVPHHLLCWQKNYGCTTFGCTGAVKETGGNDFTFKNPIKKSTIGQINQKRIEYKTEERSNQRFETLYENEPNAIQNSIPVLIERQSLLFDHQNERLMARCIFRSLTDKPIKAMLVDVLCADVWGKATESVEGFQFLDLKTRRDSYFGQTTPIPVPDMETRTIDVVIKKVLYTDQTMVEAVAGKDVLPKQETLEAFFGAQELAEEYVRESADSSKYKVVEGDKYWQCACGSINCKQEEICYRCKSDKKHLINLLNAEMIAENLETYKEEIRLKEEQEQAEREERIRQEEERMRLLKEEQERKEKEEEDRNAEELRLKKAKRKKKVKRMVLITVVVLLTGFLVYATIWHIIPYIRYQNACKALDTQSFDQAYEDFVALGEFSDSTEKAIETLYQKGIFLLNNGSYLDAATEFERIPDYQDSKDQAEYCRNEAAYHDARVLFDAGNYKDAVDAFEALSDYKDSPDQVIASKYQYAQELLESGEYEEAHKMFVSLSNYEDSKKLADECYYQCAVKLFDEKKYEGAITYFTGLSSYKDSKDRVKEAKYLYAIERSNAGDYERAINLFSSIRDYKDVSDRLQETKYQAANLLMEKKDWRNASSKFRELGDYQDSASKYKETYYQYGIQLINNRNYREAVSVFDADALKDYQDSGEKINEAKYGYVLENKNSTDSVTYAYLKDLKSESYKDSKTIYNLIYAWKASIVTNDSENNSTTRKSSISRYSTIYCHIALSGGPPGEYTTIKAVGYWPNGTTTTVRWDNNDKWTNGSAGSAYYWYYTPANGAKGTFTVKVYAGSSVIGQDSITIVN